MDMPKGIPFGLFNLIRKAAVILAMIYCLLMILPFWKNILMAAGLIAFLVFLSYVIIYFPVKVSTGVTWLRFWWESKKRQSVVEPRKTTDLK